MYPEYGSRKVDGAKVLCYLDHGRTEARVGPTDKMAQKRALARASTRIARRAQSQISGAVRDVGTVSLGFRRRLVFCRSPLSGQLAEGAAGAVACALTEGGLGVTDSRFGE